jgi:hypothetical protein
MFVSYHTWNLETWKGLKINFKYYYEYIFQKLFQPSKSTIERCLGNLYSSTFDSLIRCAIPSRTMSEIAP